MSAYHLPACYYISSFFSLFHQLTLYLAYVFRVFVVDIPYNNSYRNQITVTGWMRLSLGHATYIPSRRLLNSLLLWTNWYLWETSGCVNLVFSDGDRCVTSLLTPGVLILHGAINEALQSQLNLPFVCFFLLVGDTGVSPLLFLVVDTVYNNQRVHLC